MHHSVAIRPIRTICFAAALPVSQEDSRASPSASSVGTLDSALRPLRLGVWRKWRRNRKLLARCSPSTVLAREAWNDRAVDSRLFAVVPCPGR